MKIFKIINIRLYQMILWIVVSLAVLACDEDNDPTKKDEHTQVEIHEKLLAGSGSKTWRIISSTVNGSEWLWDCVKDDHWTFESTKLVTRQNQTNSCTNGFPDSQSSSWSIFGQKGEKLSYYGGTYEIISITETRLKLKYSNDGRTYLDTFVKVNQ